MSSTVRAIGPPTSCVRLNGMMPARLESPIVGRRPTTLLWQLGMRMEPAVSVPSVAAAKFIVAATAEPPLLPPGARVRSYGSSVCPPIELTVVSPSASSCKFTLPRITAPASRSFFT